jgi:hypothetical protein
VRMAANPSYTSQQSLIGYEEVQHCYSLTFERSAKNIADVALSH